MTYFHNYAVVVTRIAWPGKKEKVLYTEAFYVHKTVSNLFFMQECEEKNQGSKQMQTL